jgi:multicomponent Na+:H+ antiporter subunit D
MKMNDSIPVIIIIIMLSSAFICPLIRGKNRTCFVTALGSNALSFILCLYTLIKTGSIGPIIYYLGGWPPPYGIELYVDSLSAFVGTVLTGAALLIILYSGKTVEEEIEGSKVSYYYSLLLLLMGAMLGIVFTRDLFNLYVFVEICSLASCAIISIKNERFSIEATIKYLILSSLGSGMALFAIALIYSITGHLNFVIIHRELLETASIYPRNILAALSLLVAGFSLKAALFPLHIWLPDAHSQAPTPSSAFLSGLVLKVYAVSLIKILFVIFGTKIISQLPVMSLITLMASMGILIGSVLAIMQSDIKRMLAYSSVTQMGYIFLGIGLKNEMGMVGAVFHILNHALTKSNLFLAAGNIIHGSGVREIPHLAGIGRKMPVTMAAFTVSALSMVGIPLLAGFNSKWYLGLASLEASRPFFLIIILISSLLNAGYYLPVVISAFFGKDENVRLENAREAEGLALMPLIIFSLLIVALGVYPKVILDVIHKAVDGLL